jgi:hypothetical protein
LDPDWVMMLGHGWPALPCGHGGWKNLPRGFGCHLGWDPGWRMTLGHACPCWPCGQTGSAKWPRRTGRDAARRTAVIVDGW